jgi:hypothetical protein
LIHAYFLNPVKVVQEIDEWMIEGLIKGDEFPFCKLGVNPWFGVFWVIFLCLSTHQMGILCVWFLMFSQRQDSINPHD